MSGEPVEREPVAGGFVSEEAPLRIRVGHLLRIESYLDYATLSMWTGRRAEVVMGMAEASVRGAGPGGDNGPDEQLLTGLRALIREAREYHASGDFPAAMARMRVASDLISLHLVRLAGE